MGQLGPGESFFTLNVSNSRGGEGPSKKEVKKKKKKAVRPGDDVGVERKAVGGAVCKTFVVGWKKRSRG